MSPRAVAVVARLTLREASRRRLLVAVVVLTVVLIGASAWAFQRLTALPCGGHPCSPLEQKGLAAVLVMLMTFMYSFVFAVGAVFVTAPLISGEVESGVALSLVTRPLRRGELVLGKWLGVAVLIGGYTIATTGGEFIAVRALVGYTPPHPLTAIAFLVAEAVVMITLSLAFSTRLAPMTGGIIALVLFGLAWIGGIAQGIGTALGSDTVRNAGLATKFALPADGLWRGALFNIEPALVDLFGGAQSPSRTDMAANPFYVLGGPSHGYLLWVAAWVVAVLALAVLSFRRRDL